MSYRIEMLEGTTWVCLGVCSTVADALECAGELAEYHGAHSLPEAGVRVVVVCS